MNPGYCVICTDYTHAKATLTDIRRIGYALNQLVKQNVNYNVHNCPAAYVKNDTHHLHFMCGTCMKFNNSQLRQAENIVHSAAYSLCCNIQDGLISKKEYQEILRLLAGHYPMIYYTMEKIWHKSS